MMRQLDGARKEKLRPELRSLYCAAYLDVERHMAVCLGHFTSIDRIRA